MRFSNLWIVKNNSSICIVLGKDYKFNENWKWPYYLLDKRMVKGCERDMIMQHECVMKNGNDQVLECMQSWIYGCNLCKNTIYLNWVCAPQLWIQNKFYD
jgi:hypothetical protein